MEYDDAQPIQDNDAQPMQDNDLQSMQDKDAQPMEYDDAQPMQDDDATATQDDDVIFIQAKQSTQVRNKKNPKIILSSKERKTILNGGMLTDESINLAQNILSRQFSSLKGLENTTLGPLKGFSVFRGDFVQILHTGTLHWVCTANLFTDGNLKSNNLDYYDSLFSSSRKRLPLAVEQQVCQFLYTKDRSVNLKIAPVQQQSNSTNCGLFAIANATSLAFGQCPTNLTYDENIMRKHLVSCFDTDEMLPFPTKTQKTKRCKASTIEVEVFCAWRMPSKKPMAECESCQEWYHKDCENIPHAVFSWDEAEWVCKACSS